MVDRKQPARATGEAWGRMRNGRLMRRNGIVSLHDTVEDASAYRPILQDWEVVRVRWTVEEIAQ
jgi:hypothetical protein